MNNKTPKDIQNTIEEIAKSYTKEWRYDPNNPDVGMTFVNIFTKMMYETLQKFDKLMESHKDVFLGSLKTQNPQTTAAKTIVVFETNLSEIESVSIPKGTKLTAFNEKGENIYFETNDSLMAFSGGITDIFSTDEQLDKIHYHYEKESGGEIKDIPLLWMPKDKNCNRHIFWMGHSRIFHQKDRSYISIFFDIKGSEEELKSNEEALRKVLWQYYNKEKGWMEFSKVKVDKGMVELNLYEGEEIHPSTSKELYIDIQSDNEKGYQVLNEHQESNENQESNEHQVSKEHQIFKEQDIFTKDQRTLLAENYYIRGIFKEAETPYKKLIAENIKIKSQSVFHTPPLFYTDDMQILANRFAPFNEIFTLYSEFYIGDDIVFTKASSTITIQFELSFQTHEQKIELIEPDIEWKAVMKKPKIIKPVHKDSYIDEVMWEYFNGKGFATLKTEIDYKDIFDARNYNEPKTKVMMKFICPNDWEDTTVKAHNGFFLRGRIKKAENIYHMPATLYVPYVENFKIKYEYEDFYNTPQITVARNNLNTVVFNNTKTNVIYKPLEGDYHYTYFVFNQINSEPISLYFVIDSTTKEEDRLIWEYGTKTGFKSMKVLDKTNKFSYSGIITIPTIKDVDKIKLYGKEGYFIRVRKETDTKVNSDKERLGKVLKEVYTNAVLAVQQETMPDEYFFVEESKPFMQITLSRGQCMEAYVYVNEVNSLSENQMKEILKGDREVILQRNSSGDIKSFFVKWDEVMDFHESESSMRVYLLDRKNGVITFSDGNKGMLPTVSNDHMILVRYKVGGGICGNVGTNQILQSAYFLKNIRKVYNPVKAYGGSDYPSLEAKRTQNINYLTHFNRGVTHKDIERLAMEASGNIAKVKSMTYFDETGRKVAGKILLTILHKDFMKGKEVFLNEKDIISNYLERFTDACFDKDSIIIEEPGFMKINLQIWVKKQENQSTEVVNINEGSTGTYQRDMPFDLEKQIINSISSFIDPLNGGFNARGWELGTYPKKQQILTYIKFQKLPVTIVDIHMSVNELVFEESERAKARDLKVTKDSLDLQKSLQETFQKGKILVGVNGEHKIYWV